MAGEGRIQQKVFLGTGKTHVYSIGLFKDEKEVRVDHRLRRADAEWLLDVVLKTARALGRAVIATGEEVKE